MNLKLAEYKDGKFERFVELGEFLLGKNYVLLLNSDDEDADFSDYYYGKPFEIDEKDPLNRFDGLFDGRTYGEGRFVLIENDEDDVYSKLDYDGYDDIFIYTMKPAIHDDSFNICGNLHENPELFEQIN